MMARGRTRKADTKPRAYAYLRLSVDKEDGKAQSIEAQRHALRAYALKHGIEIVEEFADCGLSGRTDRRPEFNRMIAQATDGSQPVDLVLMFAIARMARNMRLFFNSIDALADAGVETVSITENFGEGRSKRIGQTITAMMAEQQAFDSAVYTRKSRRENARQGYYNGGPVPYGYQTYVAHQDGEKQRMKLEIVPGEASVVREIFDWADMGRGGRWIVGTLNARGTTLRGAKFSNSNLSGILGRQVYTGTYYDKTADDDGNTPDPEDWISVPCPMIVALDQFERVAALRASRNPRKTAPHIAAGTTMLMGIARCGMAGCTCGMTMRTGKGGRYSYYVCNARVNKGRTCDGPSVRREELDRVVLDAVERQLLAPDRLQALLAEVINLSDHKRAQREHELVHARAEQTRLRTAIERLLILVETGEMGPRDPIFAKRMGDNRAALAAATARIDALETQLARGSRRITGETVAKFGRLLSEKLRDDDPTLRTAYLRMLVSEVTISKGEILISGPRAALENGVTSGVPRLEGTVPIFDRKWCRLQDSNL
ncbi:recombinase family protein [Sphingomonas donggukensis]|uniref:Recombinase family protein n=1 Tax=Sphingomonas donggukensis TaxID=2949093 RepID=A0ABY4TR20_9SPHN|nr:recombinase family protein [Sphingomonas donggukensis]URW74835.1 recombinase family protein [Sphingomonas donggukensis]